MIELMAAYPKYDDEEIKAQDQAMDALAMFNSSIIDLEELWR